MSTLRKLERQVIRNHCRKKDGNTKNFKSAWDEHHYKRIEEVDKNGNVKSTRKRNGKRKQRHNDNGKLIIRQMRAVKSFMENMRDKAKQKETKKIK